MSFKEKWAIQNIKSQQSETTELKSNKVNWINVVENGVDNTGVLGASAKLKELCIALSALGGGTLYFPNGTYNLDANVVDSEVDFSNIIWIGENKYKTILKKSYNGTPISIIGVSVLSVNPIPRHINSFEFHNMCFSTNDDLTAINPFMDLTNTSYFLINSCRFTGAGKQLFMWEAYDSRVRFCDFDWGGNPADTGIINCASVVTLKSGTPMEYTNQIIFEGCRWENYRSPAVEFIGSITNTCNFISCKFESRHMKTPMFLWQNVCEANIFNDCYICVFDTTIMPVFYFVGGVYGSKFDIYISPQFSGNKFSTGTLIPASLIYFSDANVRGNKFNLRFNNIYNTLETAKLSILDTDKYVLDFATRTAEKFTNFKNRNDISIYTRSSDTIVDKISKYSITASTPISYENLIGAKGNYFKIADWTIAGTCSVDTTGKYGTMSLKVVSAGTSSNALMDIAGTTGHKYYVGFWYNKTGGTECVFYVLPYGLLTPNLATPVDSTIYNASGTGTWIFKSAIATATNAGIRIFMGRAGSQTFTCNFDGIVVMDLTDIYGAGSEPVATTNIDTFISTNGYFNYINNIT